MINLRKSGTVNTISIYPEISSLYSNSPSGGYDLYVTQDYNDQETLLSASLINTPTEFDPRLVLQIQSQDVPSSSGLYKTQLQEFVLRSDTWGNTNTKWVDADNRWSDRAKFDRRNIDVDRAYVSGSDIPVFTSYTSPDETGRYTTYNG